MLRAVPFAIRSGPGEMHCRHRLIADRVACLANGQTHQIRQMIRGYAPVRIGFPVCGGWHWAAKSSWRRGCQGRPPTLGPARLPVPADVIRNQFALFLRLSNRSLRMRLEHPAAKKNTVKQLRASVFPSLVRVMAEKFVPRDSGPAAGVLAEPLPSPVGTCLSTTSASR